MTVGTLLLASLCMSLHLIALFCRHRLHKSMVSAEHAWASSRAQQHSRYCSKHSAHLCGVIVPCCTLTPGTSTRAALRTWVATKL